jgi:hypothetical protein
MTGPLALLFSPWRIALRVVASFLRVGGLAGGGGTLEEGRQLRWSAPLREVVKRVNAGQEVAVWVEGRRRLLGRRRLHLLLQPLREVAIMGEGEEPVPGASREDWLVWQSLTGTAEATPLPTDAARLAARLGLPASAEGGLLERALRDLMAAVYESRSV